MTPVERERVLASFYTRERHAGTPPLEACEAMLDFAKRLDAAEQSVAEHLAIIKQCVERTR